MGKKKLYDLINNPELPDLSKLSKEDAVDVLENRATFLDVKTLSKEWQKKIRTAEPGIVPGLLVQGKFGMEEVVVCTSVAAGYEPNRDAFTTTEHDFMMVEVNWKYRAEEEREQEKGKSRFKIPFICKYCDQEFYDKATLGWHRKMGHCPCYKYRDYGPLKIYPARGLDGNKVARAVFQKYNLRIPWQMLGKRQEPVQAKKKKKKGTKRDQRETSSEEEGEGLGKEAEGATDGDGEDGEQKLQAATPSPGTSLKCEP